MGLVNDASAQFAAITAPDSDPSLFLKLTDNSVLDLNQPNSAPPDDRAVVPPLQQQQHAAAHHFQTQPAPRPKFEPPCHFGKQKWHLPDHDSSTARPTTNVLKPRSVTQVDREFTIINRERAECQKRRCDLQEVVLIAASAPKHFKKAKVLLQGQMGREYFESAKL